MSVYILERAFEIQAIHFDGENFGKVQQFCGVHRSPIVSLTINSFNRIGTYFYSENPAAVGELWVEILKSWVGVPEHTYILKNDFGCFALSPEVFQKYFVKKDPHG